MNIFKSIYRLFVPAPTVSTIMSSFQKQQDALDALALECQEEQEVLKANLVALNAKLMATIDERTKAVRMSAKIADFTA